VQAALDGDKPQGKQLLMLGLCQEPEAAHQLKRPVLRALLPYGERSCDAIGLFQYWAHRITLARMMVQAERRHLHLPTLTMDWIRVCMCSYPIT
jgi:hypothetical protein